MTTIFCDENMPPMIARALAALGKDAVTISDQPAGIHPGMKDIEWMPLISKKGWPVLTKDSAILRNKLERALFRAHKLVGFFIKDVKKHHLSAWDLVKLVINRFEDIENLARATQGPMAYEISPTAKKFKPIDLH